MTKHFVVDDRAAGQRLDVVLAQVTGMSRSAIRALIEGSNVTVHGKNQPARYPCKRGDEISLTITQKSPKIHIAPNLPIIYEDDDMLVVNKPAGLSVHPGAGTEDVSTVSDFARHHTSDPDAQRPGIVHRLDKDTSGLLMIAKTLPAKSYLQNQIIARAVVKTYVALVIGKLAPETATIDLPLGRDAANPLKQAVRPDGRQARTHYEVQAIYPGYSFVEARLETGRTHQLRVHFAAVGHPIAGDIVYGTPTRTLDLKRQFLHAAKLELDAPNGKRLILNAPLAPDLHECLSRLEKSV